MSGQGKWRCFCRKKKKRRKNESGKESGVEFFRSLENLVGGRESWSIRLVTSAQVHVIVESIYKINYFTTSLGYRFKSITIS